MKIRLAAATVAALAAPLLLPAAHALASTAAPASRTTIATIKGGHGCRWWDGEWRCGDRGDYRHGDFDHYRHRDYGDYRHGDYRHRDFGDYHHGGFGRHYR